MYHPTIQKLDSVASDFHAMGMMTSKNSALRLAGQTQLELFKQKLSPKILLKPYKKITILLVIVPISVKMF
jgi:hypothetical protein